MDWRRHLYPYPPFRCATERLSPSLGLSGSIDCGGHRRWAGSEVLYSSWRLCFCTGDYGRWIRGIQEGIIRCELSFLAADLDLVWRVMFVSHVLIFLYVSFRISTISYHTSQPEYDIPNYIPHMNIVHFPASCTVHRAVQCPTPPSRDKTLDKLSSPSAILSLLSRPLHPRNILLSSLINFPQPK